MAKIKIMSLFKPKHFIVKDCFRYEIKEGKTSHMSMILFVLCDK